MDAIFLLLLILINNFILQSFLASYSFLKSIKKYLNCQFRSTNKSQSSFQQQQNFQLISNTKLQQTKTISTSEQQIEQAGMKKVASKKTPQKQKPRKLSFSDRIKMIFCGKTQQQQPIIYDSKKNQKKQNQSQPTIKKQVRQTLKIDDVFIKLSRKNVVEEEFHTHEVLNLQLEKHIATRIKECTTVLVSGEFTQETTFAVRVPMYLTEKPGKTIPYRQQLKSNSFLRIRSNCIDLVLYQTKLTIQLSNKKKKGKLQKSPKPQKKQLKGQQIRIQSQQPDINIAQQQKIQKKSQQQLQQILDTLYFYKNIAQNFVIVCSKHTDPLEHGKSFMNLSKDYLFELERVRQNQELICNVIYVGRNAGFLRINDKQFKEYVMEEMDLTIDQQAKIEPVLTKLIELRYHKQIGYCLRSLKKQIFTTRSLYEPFITRICGQNQYIKSIIISMKNRIFSQQQIKQTPQLVEPTPLFHNSVNLTTSRNLRVSAENNREQDNENQNQDDVDGNYELIGGNEECNQSKDYINYEKVETFEDGDIR